MDLKWMVYKEDWNNKLITTFNIFRHHSYKKEIERIIEMAQMGLTKDNFEKEIRHLSQYYFWSKSEYEIVMTSWPPYIDANNELDRLINEKRENKARGWSTKYLDIRPVVAEKISIYDQLLLNWDAFIDYLWLNKERIK